MGPYEQCREIGKACHMDVFRLDHGRLHLRCHRRRDAGMTTDHYFLFFDLALFALAFVFLGKLTTQWVIQERMSKRLRAVALVAMLALGWAYIIFRYGAIL